MGQPLTIIGYPGIGGTGSRSSISITKGIVSGFQRTPFGTIIKTDAEINGGNSGGAAINAYYELVGLPTMVVNEDAGQMGFIHPVNLLPRDWVDLIERD
jgi:S1-C subfamily serine protease